MTVESERKRKARRERNKLAARRTRERRRTQENILSSVSKIDFYCRSYRSLSAKHLILEIRIGKQNFKPSYKKYMNFDYLSGCFYRMSIFVIPFM